MATINEEKRFGPEFFTGKEEEPGPSHYQIASDFDELLKKQGSTHGSLPKAPRVSIAKQPDQNYTERPLSIQLPGEFPKAYTTKDIQRKKKNARLLSDMRPPGQPSIYQTDKFPLEKLKLGAGAGSYNTSASRDMNLEKISTKNSFGKSKRFGIVDFMRQQGQVGVSPGVGSYSPKNHEINKVINEKPDLRRMIAREQDDETLLNDKSLETSKSAKEFRRTFRKISNSYATPQTWTVHERFMKKPDFREPGPGTYNSGTDFKFSTKSRLKSTFGSTKRKDLLSSLEDAGFVAISELGPGTYEADTNTFDPKTLNTKCGYKKLPSQQRRLRSTEYTVPNSSRMFSDRQRGDKLDQNQMWKALMKPPDPSMLGYKSHLGRNVPSNVVQIER